MSNQSTSRFGVGFLCGTVFGIVIAIGGWELTKHFSVTPKVGQNSERQQTPSQDQSLPSKQPDQASPPQFDAKDVQRTNFWAAELIFELVRVQLGQNAIANKSASEAMDGKLKEIVGHRVNWQFPVDSVQQWGVILNGHVELRDAQSNPQRFLHVVRHGSPVLSVSIGDGIQESAAARLRQGDLVNLQGTVRTAAFDFLERCIRIELVNVTVTSQ